MTFFISHVHEDLRATRFSKRGSTHKVEDVPRGVHKTYARMEKITLPEPRDIELPLKDILERRSSYHGGTDRSTLSLQDCGTLFGHALGKRNPSFHRNYPSGGALYPIETYFITAALPKTPPTAFHYNPTEHALEKLWPLPGDLVLKELARHPDDLFFSSLVIFTAVWKRSSAKYGDFTYTVALLEAGHMSENMLLVGTALGLRMRPMAGFEDDKLLKLLDLDPEEEQPVHSITMC